MSQIVPGLILIAVGVLAMLGAAFNWRLVTHSGKLFNRLLGDRVARVIYFCVGIFLFVKGIELAIDASWFPF